ncbi:MAG TPA: hypothetical protein VGX25_04030 [Actinophytocola sp.]|uniref:hypothetical protein n=1 Tax=Actinophytocola sp. TaxID=1872138 RepID=UPI002DDCBC5B|nr:hypothetical protein [Actinophytocola sp.]HEV2778547.1 hypothetical protein [Actinophytocola sp.]
MAGTNAVAAKKALIDGLAAAPDLVNAGVQVAYSYPGHDAERELIHGGRVEGTHDYPVSGSGPRFKRDEQLTIKLHIVVTKPGATVYDVEARCAEIGTVVEELIAGDPDLVNVPRLQWTGISAVDLDSSEEDEHAIGVLTYDVFAKSRLD